jgi:hypothetical protein
MKYRWSRLSGSNCVLTVGLQFANWAQFRPNRWLWLCRHRVTSSQTCTRAPDGNVRPKLSFRGELVVSDLSGRFVARGLCMLYMLVVLWHLNSTAPGDGAASLGFIVCSA